MSSKDTPRAAPALRPAMPGAVLIRFWGVRGSVPVPGPTTLRYGGNTACVEVRTPQETVILDAGTGLRGLGRALCDANAADSTANGLWILISHTHWDHIQGFPFFAPAYQARQRIRIVGRRGSRAGLRRTIAAAVESPFFPVALPDMPSHISVEELTARTFQLGSIRASTAPLRHPGGGIGFRLETVAGSIVYVPDHEIPCGHGFKRTSRSGPRPHPTMARLIAGADVLIHDAQYTAAEYEERRGWGHSCVDSVVRTAVAAGVRRLLLFHHDPERTDAQLDRLVRAARALARSLGSRMGIDASREGLTLTLPLPLSLPAPP